MIHNYKRVNYEINTWLYTAFYILVNKNNNTSVAMKEKMLVATTMQIPVLTNARCEKFTFIKLHVFQNSLSTSLFLHTLVLFSIVLPYSNGEL